jgi:hypothetical protein
VLTGAGGESVRLEPRLMDLLVLFAGSGGRVLGKDEIARATWGGRVIGDDTLAAAISRLRRALGESRERRYIETVPKRGYRALVEAPPGGLGARAAMADLFAEQPMLFMRRGFHIASLRAIAGQTDAAFAALEAAAARGDPVLMLFPWLPFFDPLKADPRYEPLASGARLAG